MRTTTLTDVRTVAIDVRDPNAALDFYVDTLGFEKRLDAGLGPGMRWIEVAPPGATTSLALNIGARAGTDTGIRFTVPDADAEHVAMTSRGVAAGDVLRWDGVPPMYTFDDPDGNRFYIVEASG
jgi:catechol 2,3-dioxygenase-like lactoylglutathione lyase family enzyme